MAACPETAPCQEKWLNFFDLLVRHVLFSKHVTQIMTSADSAVLWQASAASGFIIFDVFCLQRREVVHPFLRASFQLHQLFCFCFGDLFSFFEASEIDQTDLYKQLFQVFVKTDTADFWSGSETKADRRKQEQTTLSTFLLSGQQAKGWVILY